MIYICVWCVTKACIVFLHRSFNHIFVIYHPDTPRPPRGLHKLYMVPDPKDQTDAQWDHPPFHQNSCWTCSIVILSFWKTRPTIYTETICSLGFGSEHIWHYLHMERRLSPSKIAKHNWQRKPMKNQIQLTKGSSSASDLNSSFRVPHWFLLDSKYAQLANTFNLSGHGHADSNMCKMDFGIKLCYDFFLWKRPCSLKKGVPLSSATWYNKHLLMKSSFLVLFLRVAQWFKLSEVCQSEALWGCLNLFQHAKDLKAAVWIIRTIVKATLIIACNK